MVLAILRLPTSLECYWLPLDSNPDPSEHCHTLHRLLLFLFIFRTSKELNISLILLNTPGPSFCTHLLSEELQPIKQFNRHLPCAGSCAWSCGDDGRIRSSLCFQIPSTPSGEKGSLQKGRSLRTQVFGKRWRGHGHPRGR